MHHVILCIALQSHPMLEKNTQGLFLTIGFKAMERTIANFAIPFGLMGCKKENFDPHYFNVEQAENRKS